MKKRMLIAIGLAVFACGVALAVVLVPFHGWDALIAKSPEIIIVKCLKAPEETLFRGNGIAEVTEDGVWPSEIEVVAVLKGTTNRGPVRLYSQLPLRRGEDYLIFAYFYDTYSASEEYRIVPLGSDFSTNVLAGKQLDAQVQTLLQFRLDHLNREMENLQAEKACLELGVRK